MSHFSTNDEVLYTQIDGQQIRATIMDARERYLPEVIVRKEGGSFIRVSVTDLTPFTRRANSSCRWGDMRECEKAWYMAHWAPMRRLGNVGPLLKPRNNDIMQRPSCLPKKEIKMPMIGQRCNVFNWEYPTEQQLNMIRYEGTDEFKRMTWGLWSWQPTDEERKAMILWLKELNSLENAYKRLSLAKIFEENKYIPFDLCEIINNHLTTILNE